MSKKQQSQFSFYRYRSFSFVAIAPSLFPSFLLLKDGCNSWTMQWLCEKILWLMIDDWWLMIDDWWKYLLYVINYCDWWQKILFDNKIYCTCKIFMNDEWWLNDYSFSFSSLSLFLFRRYRSIFPSFDRWSLIDDQWLMIDDYWLVIDDMNYCMCKIIVNEYWWLMIKIYCTCRLLMSDNECV